VAAVRIAPIRYVLQTSRAIGRDQLIDVASDRIATATEDVDRQSFGNARPPRGFGERRQCPENVDEKLHLRVETAQRIRDVLVDFDRIAREPVERRARRTKRLVEGAKEQPLQELTLAARPHSESLEVRDQEPQRRCRGRPSIGTGERRRDDSIAMVADKLLNHERSQRMAEDHDWRLGMVRSDSLVQLPEIMDALVPAIAFGEKSQVRGLRRRAPVSAMIVGVNRVAFATQVCGYPRITGGVFRPTVRDLHNRLRRLLRQPAIDEQRQAIESVECKGRSLH